MLHSALLKAMLVPQVHLPVSLSALERLSMAAWVAMVSPPRKIHKNARQILTFVAVVMAVWLSVWCIAVCPWSFVLIFCSIDVRMRVVRAHTQVGFCVFLYKLNKISRFNALTASLLSPYIYGQFFVAT